MAKNIAPPKLTGGGGFVFENKVAAYFLTYLQSGKPPLNPGFGKISRIAFQTRADGWFLDDILLTLKFQEESRNCAFSVKSSQQFTKNCAPKEFVTLAWEQFLHEGTTQFDKTHDILGLITPPLPQNLSNELQELLDWARSQNPRDLPNRLRQPGYATDTKRNLFASFTCPETLAKKYVITEANTGELLRCTQILQFDFEQDPSNRLKEAVQNCQDVLVSGSTVEAHSLWESLLVIADEHRSQGGCLDLPRLVGLLRTRFQLKEFPDYQADWIHLLSQTRDRLSVIPTTIGHKVFLTRDKEIKTIELAFDKSKVVILLGPSGCGKTVLAKHWAEKELGSNKVIWLNARSFNVLDFNYFQRDLGVNHPLQDILAATPNPCAYMIIDGLDRIFSDSAFQNLSAFINAIRLNTESSPWRVIITCQPEEWDRIRAQLARANVLTSEWWTVAVEDPTNDDLRPVWNTFPELVSLTLQPRLRSLLLKPKVLDLLATRLSISGPVDTAVWVGESDLIEWFWETEVSKPPNATTRARFLMELSEKQADSLQDETPVGEFSISDLEPLEGLIQDRICNRREERLSFYHDLYGDWARQRILLSQTNTLREYLEPRLTSPLWHRAIRLYSLHLLERNQDLTQWKAAFGTITSSDSGGNLAQDLLVESIIFAANSLPLFECLWLELKANDGLLLRRLLERFLHLATMPNPLVMEFAKTHSPELGIEAATIQRVPYWPYWLPMLHFLYKYLNDVIDLAPKQVAEIADTWLRQGGEKWPLRREAAELALAIAEKILNFKQGNGIRIVQDKLDEIAYKAALAGCRELPDRVVAFALEASARKEPSVGELETSDKTEPIAKREVISSIYGTYIEEIPPPWPDGPSRRVDPEFQKICLKTDALHPLIMNNPSVAREVLLALLIEEPRARHPFESRSTLHDNLGIEYFHGLFPPFYTRGPLLFFLKNQPTEGLKLIIRLINFATERWADRWREEQKIPPKVVITISDNEREWIGDYRVYYWYRDHGPCPDAIVVALMALEKWLYDEIEQKKPIDTVVESIFQRANSVAFAGVLSAVGSKEPSLFQGPLRPLFSVPEFHHWELHYSLQSHDYLLLGWWNQGKLFIELAYKWHTLPHRKHGLHVLAKMLFLNMPQMRPFFEQVRSDWTKRLEADKDDELKDYLRSLIAQYDIKNYRCEKDPKHGEVWVYEPPKKLLEKNEKELKEIEVGQILLTFPVQCRQILDGGQPLPPGNLEQFWTYLQRIASMAPPSGSDPEIVSVENATCGGVAVLLQFHQDWLNQHPDRKDWCIKQLLKIIQNPPKERLNIDVDAATWHWDSFCAQAIPILWAEDPDSPTLCTCIALLAASERYKTVEILFDSTSKVRAHLGENFKQLQHFLLSWAAARWKRGRTCHQKKPSFNVEKWLRKEIKAFVKKSIRPQIPPWEELAVKEPPLERFQTGQRKRRPRQSPGLDLTLIQAAYSWLPSLDQATSETERAEWIAFWKEALGCSLRMLGEENGDDGEIEGTPYDWDRWVFKNIVLLITQLRATERPEDFWKPILNLGTPGHYWVEDFLTMWFRSGLCSEPVSNAFVKEWRSMVEFAHSSPKWSSESSHSWFHLEKIWISLMGFDWTMVDRWNDAQKPIVRQMHDIYKRWAEAYLSSPGCAKAFIVFLKQPAAEEILLDGLIWLEKAAGQVGNRFWNERDIQNSLASLLDVCWHSHQSKLRMHHASFGAFRNLLKQLVDRQNRLAMELQDRM